MRGEWIEGPPQHEGFFWIAPVGCGEEPTVCEVVRRPGNKLDVYIVGMDAPVPSTSVARHFSAPLAPPLGSSTGVAKEGADAAN